MTRTWSWMRRPLDGAPSELRPVPGGWSVRHPGRGDVEALADLLLAAYRGTIDDQGETLDEARADVTSTLGGTFGDFLAEASLVAEDGDDGRLMGASLITLWEGVPLVAFSMTRPEAKGRGLATALLSMSLVVLREAGHREVRLVVTDGNDPAVRVYERLGFQRAGPLEPRPDQH